jgi:hypothetical protein
MRCVKKSKAALPTLALSEGRQTRRSHQGTSSKDGGAVQLCRLSPAKADADRPVAYSEGPLRCIASSAALLIVSTRLRPPEISYSISIVCRGILPIFQPCHEIIVDHPTVVECQCLHSYRDHLQNKY